jgi:hypothetical protein
MTVGVGDFLLVALFMNQWQSSQQTSLLPTTDRAVLHSKSSTVIDEKTTVKDNNVVPGLFF